MTLPVLEILPDTARYRARPAGRALRTRFDGAQSRYRRTYDGPPEVSVQWTLNAPQYDSIVDFYRTSLQNGSLPFTMDLIIEDGTPETHTARIVPGSFRLSGIAGTTYTVTAGLEVVA